MSRNCQLLFPSPAIGKDHKLVPIVSEQHEEKNYLVAIVKRNNKGFNLNSLRGKMSCHAAARGILGWNIPIGYLMRRDIIPALRCKTGFQDFNYAASF